MEIVCGTVACGSLRILGHRTICRKHEGAANQEELEDTVNGDTSQTNATIGQLQFDTAGPWKKAGGVPSEY